MQLQIKLEQKLYHVDLQQSRSLAIPLQFNDAQPNHFGAPKAVSHALEAGGFIGDTQRGGSCNVRQISFTPHCNGTHTESVQHIVDQPVAAHQAVGHGLMPITIISIEPQYADIVDESYIPALEENDRVVSATVLRTILAATPDSHLEALAIRTLPNVAEKLSKSYDIEDQPPFFTREATAYLIERGIKHILVDFPSIDRMHDDGVMTNHHQFWRIEEGSHQLNDSAQLDKSVTEMIFIEDKIADGLYLLNLQVPAFETDAAPCRPIVFPLCEI